MFVGSAITNFGVGLLLDGIVDLAPPPSPRLDADGAARKLDDPFSAFVFKVQANMDRSHRDRVAFVRVCSGRFERGMVVTHEPTGRPFATKYAHSVFGQERETLDEAFPGDIVALVNATDVRVGDTLYVDAPVEFPRLPEFAPEHFVTARALDTGRYKQFRKGVAQLDEEGVVQVLRDPDLGDQAPVFAAVGPMQLEVASWRLEHEFGSQAELSPTPYTVARRTDETSAPAAAGHARRAGALPGRRHLVRAVREPLLAGQGRVREPRAHARTPGGRGHRGLSRRPGTPGRQQVVPSSGTSRSTR